MENSAEISIPVTKKKRNVSSKYLYPLVEVVWLDAVTHNAWVDLNELMEKVSPSLTMTVAFLMKEDAEAYYMASTYHEGESNAQITVPKGMVKSFRVLKKPTAGLGRQSDKT